MKIHFEITRSTILIFGFIQVNLRDAMDVSTISVDLTPVAPVAPVLPPVLAAPAVRADWDSERERLYQQLDDKVGLLSKFFSTPN